MSLVSVIIPAYNYAQYLPETIKSVIDQTLSDWECIIVDDGSTDSTKDVAQKYTINDNRIHYFYKTNGGLSSARNFGLQKAKGKYVIFLDADDLLEPNNLKHLSAFLDTQISDSIVFGSFIKFYNDKSPDYPWYQDYSYKEGLQDKFASLLVEKNMFPCCAPLSPLSIIKELNITFDEALTSYEDWDFWLRLSSHCNFYYIPGENAAARVRFHSGSMSTDNWRMEINQLKVRLKLTHHISNKTDNLSNDKGIESSVKTLLYSIAENIAEGNADKALKHLEVLIGIYPHRKIKILNHKFLLSHPTLFRKCVWILWERIRNIVGNK